MILSKSMLAHAPKSADICMVIRECLKTECQTYRSKVKKNRNPRHYPGQH